MIFNFYLFLYLTGIHNNKIEADFHWLLAIYTFTNLLIYTRLNISITV